MAANSLTQATPAPQRKPSAMQSWLDNACLRVNASHALLVVQQGSQVKPLACVPAMQGPQLSIEPGVLQVARRALKDKRVVVRENEQTSAQLGATEGSVVVGMSMRMSGRPGAVVFRLVAKAAEEDSAIMQRVAEQTLRRAEDQVTSAQANSESLPRVKPEVQPSAVTQPSETQPKTIDNEDSVAPVLGSGANNELESVSQLVSEQGSLLGSVAALIDETDLDQSLHALACRLALQYRCLRVYVGCVVGRQVAIRAVSGLVDFDAKSALMVDVVQAMNETRMLASTVRLPETDTEHVPPQSHASLAEQLNNPALISVPLTTEETVVGVLFFERDRSFSDTEAAQLERLSLLISPMLALKATEAMSVWQWLRRFSGRGLRGVFGPSHLGLKLTLCAVAILVGASASITQMHRVDANASLEPSTQRAVVSGFASFLSLVEARAGDIVRNGDVLARLDVDELELDRIKWLGEREKLNKEYRANLAQRDRSKVRVLEAQRSQAQAKIDLIDTQIDRATLRAPIDGVVVSGDHFQSLGRPVERGELLFEVASLDDFRLILQLDEKDIGWVKLGSKGELRLRSLTDRTFPFEVTGITPVSEPGEGANTFRVEANLEKLPESLRSGMQGVAKIDVEPRAVGWIWTRSFVDWVRMQIWKFGGF